MRNRVFADTFFTQYRTYKSRKFVEDILLTHQFPAKNFRAFSGCSELQYSYRISIPSKFWKKNFRRVFRVFAIPARFQGIQNSKTYLEFYSSKFHFCAVPGCSAFRLFFRVDDRITYFFHVIIHSALVIADHCTYES